MSDLRYPGQPEEERRAKALEEAVQLMRVQAEAEHRMEVHRQVWGKEEVAFLAEKLFVHWMTERDSEKSTQEIASWAVKSAIVFEEELRKGRLLLVEGSSPVGEEP